MKLNLEFVNKTPKLAKDYEIILVKDKSSNSKKINSLFNNNLFIEKKFLLKSTGDKTYIFVNSSNIKNSLDYEKLGSQMYIFLRDNKIEKSFLASNTTYLTSIQLEKFLHGAQLKSYEFNVYKTDKSKIKKNNLYIVGDKSKKSNLLRNKLNSLLKGVFLTRDLVSEPGNVLHPDEYARRIVKLKKIWIKSYYL